jgi:hypothetical protein
MAKSFASGKRSKGLCDRCGFKFPYRKLKMEPGTNLMVDAECYDGRWNRVDHPQNFPPRDLIDAQGLRNPRTDRPIAEELPDYLLDHNGELILDEYGYPIHI